MSYIRLDYPKLFSLMKPIKQLNCIYICKKEKNKKKVHPFKGATN
jgi:hypothetical protein